MLNIAIFASGSGTNAENIAKTFNNGNLVHISLVLTNRANAGVRARMEPLDVPVVYVPNYEWDNNPQSIVNLLKAHGIDLIVLAGFMHFVSPEILEAFPGRVINIHPSLLPAFGGKGMYGHHVHEAVIAAGERRSGVTVHYVTEEMDKGEIILQEGFELAEGETPESLEARIHPLEYSIYPRAIMKVAADINRENSLPQTARVEEPELPRPEAERQPELPRPEAQTPPPTPTTDEEWARVLQIPFSSAEAEAAAEKLRTDAERMAEEQKKQTPPPNPFATAPQGNQQQNEPMPKSYLLWAILATLMCCSILGIVAIIYSCMVSTKYYAGDIDGAKRASRLTQIWIIASFVIGLITATIYFPLMIF